MPEAMLVPRGRAVGSGRELSGFTTRSELILRRFPAERYRRFIQRRLSGAIGSAGSNLTDSVETVKAEREDVTPLA